MVIVGMAESQAKLLVSFPRRIVVQIGEISEDHPLKPRQLALTLVLPKMTKSKETGI